MRNPDRKNLRRLARPGALVAVFLLAVPAAGQLLVGRPIVSVEYAGVETLSEDSLNYYLDIEAGKPWDPGRVNERIKDLWERKLIDDISIAAEAQDEGVLVRVTVTERPLLVSLEYDGLKKVKRSDIGDMTDRERISVFEGLPLDLGELARLEGAIKKLYEERGFRFAGIHIEIQDAGLGEKRVLITVDEGGRVKIGQVDFEGNEVFSAGRLRRQMEKTKKSNLLTRIRKRDVFNSATVQEDLDKVKDLYRRFGYKDVEVGEPELDVIERKPNAERIEERKRQLALVIPLEEGPRWKLGEVDVEGAEILPEELLVRMFKDPKGGWLRSDVIDEGVEQVQELYRNSGYIFADVKMEIVERDDLVADILVTVEENDQFRIGRLEFTGNDRTRDRVLRRQMLLKEGDVFNTGMLRTSLLRLSQLEYYVVDENEQVDVDYDMDDQQVDITVKGSETGQTEVQFGGGYSELDGLLRPVGVAHPQLPGTWRDRRRVDPDRPLPRHLRRLLLHALGQGPAAELRGSALQPGYGLRPPRRPAVPEQGGGRHHHLRPELPPLGDGPVVLQQHGHRELPVADVLLLRQPGSAGRPVERHVRAGVRVQTAARSRPRTSTTATTAVWSRPRASA